MKKVLIVFFVFLLAYFGIGMLMPSEFTAGASVDIQAPRQKVYAVIASLRTWPEWTIWNKETDPQAEFVFEGAESGAGAVWKWTSEGDLGTGSLRITKAEPSEVQLALQFGGVPPSPMTIQLDEAGDSTRVTWSTKGDFGNAAFLLFRWLNAFGFIEKVVTKDYNTSLSKLKTRLETKAKSAPVEATMKKQDGEKK